MKAGGWLSGEQIRNGQGWLPALRLLLRHHHALAPSFEALPAHPCRRGTARRASRRRWRQTAAARRAPPPSRCSRRRRRSPPSAARSCSRRRPAQTPRLRARPGGVDGGSGGRRWWCVCSGGAWVEESRATLKNSCQKQHIQKSPLCQAATPSPSLPSPGPALLQRLQRTHRRRRVGRKGTRPQHVAQQVLRRKLGGAWAAVAVKHGKQPDVAAAAAVVAAAAGAGAAAAGRAAAAAAAAAAAGAGWQRGPLRRDGVLLARAPAAQLRVAKARLAVRPVACILLCGGVVLALGVKARTAGHKQTVLPRAHARAQQLLARALRAACGVQRRARRFSRFTTHTALCPLDTHKPAGSTADELVFLLFAGVAPLQEERMQEHCFGCESVSGSLSFVSMCS